MKKTVAIFVMITLMSSHAMGQFREKDHPVKTGGWVLLASGLVMTTLSIGHDAAYVCDTTFYTYSTRSVCYDRPEKKSNIKLGLAGLGVALAGVVMIKFGIHLEKSKKVQFALGPGTASIKFSF